MTNVEAYTVALVLRLTLEPGELICAQESRVCKHWTKLWVLYCGRCRNR